MSEVQITAFVVAVLMGVGVFVLAFIERGLKATHILGLLIVVICYFPIFGYFPSSIEWGSFKIAFFKELQQKVETTEKILGTYNRKIISPVDVADLRG